jgi:hypothetical protein
VAYLSGHGAWNTAFLVGACFALVSAIIWAFIDPSHSVRRECIEPVGRLHWICTDLPAKTGEI